MRVEGYISKKTIAYWLENYDSLQAKDRPLDAPVVSSGPKPADGVTSNQLNKVMLDQAIENLPPLTKACCKARWVYRFRIKQTVRTLDITTAIYYSRCEMAVDLIYKELNGEKASYVALMRKINS